MEPASGDIGALYVRVLSIRLLPGKMDEFRAIYQHEILPVLYKTRAAGTPISPKTRAIPMKLFRSLYGIGKRMRMNMKGAGGSDRS